MKFTGVAGTNLKGRTFKYPLTPLTLVTGDHEEGKSAVADALRLASCGYDPRLGKRPMDTIRLATGDVMTVAVEIDGRPAGNQIWNRTKSGASKEGEPAMQIPVTLFDLSEFLNMTAAERSKYVFGLADPEKIGFGVETFVSALWTIRTNETEAPFIESIIDELKLKKESADKAGTPAAQWLDEFYNGLDERQKQADRTVKALTQASRGSVVSAATDTEDIPEDIDTRVKAKRDEQHALFENMATVRETRRTIANKISDIDAAKADLAAPDRADDIAKMQRDLDEAEIEMEQVPDTGQKNFRAVSDANNAAIKAEREANAALEEANRKEVELEAEIKSVETQCKCETCDQKLTPERKKKLTTTLKKELATAVKLTKKLTTAHAEAEAALAKTHEALVEFTENAAKRAKLEGKCRDIRTKLDPMKEAQQARETAQAKIDALGNEEELRAEFNRLATDLNVAAEKAATLQRELDTLVDQQRRQIARREQERAAALNKEQREGKEREARLLKAAKEKIGEERDKLNEKVWGTLLGTARKFTAGILKAGELAFHEGELGYWRGATFVTYKTFSGAQRTLAFIGVAVALCQHSPIRIVILDEVAAIHKYRTSVATRLADLIQQGVIDQAIIIDPDPSVYESKIGFPEGTFSTIKVGA